jgi:NADH-quinone oxidoreductase subunit G/NADP-reducing hydrogenase subunit HndD
MPCTAKKYEAKREEMIGDIDAVITTVEFANLLKQKEIDLSKLKETDFDIPLGVSTGAGAIFGNTGGVMEAALRTTYEFSEKKELEKIEFTSVRGLNGIKEATITIKGKDIKVAVVHTLSNAKKILEDIKNNKCEYTFIEVMACPGGCIGGGGQPYTTNNIRKKRIDSLYEIDSNSNKRKSHQNEIIQKLYKDFLIEPLSEKSHELLHTNYTSKEKK